MAVFNDPEVQKGIWGAFLALISLVWLWFKRRLGLVDELRLRVEKLERSSITIEALDKSTADLKAMIMAGHESILERLGKAHDRIDDMYKHMPKRSDNGR